MSFTQATTFLRPDVTRILWLERVLESEKAAFEKRMNASILGVELNLTTVKRSPDTEYAPIVYASQDGIPFLMVDPTSVPSIKPAVENARDTGLSSMSPPDLYGGVWRMGCYLAYYGNSSNGNPVSSSSLSTVEMRREACLGYLGASLAVELVFTAVLSR
jgi:hypothetical protein